MFKNGLKDGYFRSLSYRLCLLMTMHCVWYWIRCTAQLYYSHASGSVIATRWILTNSPRCDGINLCCGVVRSEPGGVDQYSSYCSVFQASSSESGLQVSNTTRSLLVELSSWKKYTSGPRYWNVRVLVNTGTFLVYQYCLKMWYICSQECVGVIQKLTILECKNGLVLSDTRVPVSGTWSLLFPSYFITWNLTVYNLKEETVYCFCGNKTVHDCCCFELFYRLELDFLQVSRFVGKVHNNLFLILYVATVVMILSALLIHDLYWNSIRDKYDFL